MSVQSYYDQSFCGCWYVVRSSWGGAEQKYLPQTKLSSHTTILATSSRTVLTQTFLNTSDAAQAEIQYTFPLYDGVSVVGFKCTVAGNTIVGKVKERQQARADYQEAVDRGETAGLLEQLPEASDVFTTSIGNVPGREKILVEIVYLGELKHDAETDGSRFTIPTIIAPRYGNTSPDSAQALQTSANAGTGTISVLVDIAVDEGSNIRGVQSPSHPIAVTMGRLSSTVDENAFDNHHASASLTLGTTELDKDFVIVVLAKEQGMPRALLETHPTIPESRALMATLVPKFNLPNILPEIVFVIDRSGSMEGKIPMLLDAMRIFLKSLPVGCKFNICSFGSSHSFLFKESRTYDQNTLRQALNHVDTFAADFGGTEMFQPIEATVKKRYKDMSLEVIVASDGEIWQQQQLFDFINASTSDGDVRFFSLGIGSGASSSLIEGIARAGNGFAQFVNDNEKMDKRIVRMLKGALTPHINDFELHVKYEQEAKGEDDFEIIEPVIPNPRELFSASQETLVQKEDKQKPKNSVSLFNTDATEQPTNPPAGRYDHLPQITPPSYLQAPTKIPTLYPFSRTAAYVLLGPGSCQQRPKSVILRATSKGMPLELEIPVQDVGTGETVHQLAAKKACQELEQGRGWLNTAKEGDELLKIKHPGRWDEIVEREAVRLGVQFQVGGKWCSFVAVETNPRSNGAQQPDSSARLVSGRSAGRSVSGKPAGKSVSSSRFSGLRTAFSSSSSIRGATSPRSSQAAPAMFGGGGAIPPPPAVSSSYGGFGSPMQVMAMQDSATFGRAPPPNHSAAPGGAGPYGSSSSGHGQVAGFRARRHNPGSLSVKKESKQKAKQAVNHYEPGFNAEEKFEIVDDGNLNEAILDAVDGADTKMHRLIALQSFDGSWKLEPELLAVIHQQKDTLLQTFSGRTPIQMDVVATMAAICFFEDELIGEKDAWEMVVEKAKLWLSGQFGPEYEVQIAKMKAVPKATSG